MGGGYVGNAAVFLISTLFGLYILVVMLRFLLQLVRADFYNPISQLLVRITNPPLRPLRRLIPGFGGVDVAAIVLMLALKAVEFALIAAVDRPFYSGAAGLVVLAIADLLSLLLNVYFFAILIQVIMSWVNPGGYHPALRLLHQLNEPVMRPARAVIPPLGGLDLSPVLVLIALQLGQILLVAPLMDLARQL